MNWGNTEVIEEVGIGGGGEVVESFAVTCPKCGKVIGELVDVAGVTFLKSGSLVIKFTSAFCGGCYQPFYWDVNERKLARILARLNPSRPPQNPTDFMEENNQSITMRKKS